MAEVRGNDIIYAVDPTPDGTTTDLVRIFNQTGGSRSREKGLLELQTKDKNGVGYDGTDTTTVSLEGVLTSGDTAITAIKTAMDTEAYVRIYRINKVTKDAEWGDYAISSFEESEGNGEYVTYSLEATLNGDLTAVTLTTVPAGA